MALPLFGFVTVHQRPLVDGVAREAEWLDQVAASGRPTARLWQSPTGFVVPRSYVRRAHWAEACAASAADGWPVQVRSSGGGLVPQGPGLWNLSLAWPSPDDTPAGMDAIYRALAAELGAAFARLGVAAAAQAVDGSFCDGRYNLAVDGRKVVGTAQAWRRIAGRYVVLAHAVIVASADPGELVAAANRFEERSGGATRYRVDALASLAQAWREAHRGAPEPPDLERQFLAAIAERFARVAPPNVQPA